VNPAISTLPQTSVLNAQATVVFASAKTHAFFRSRLCRIAANIAKLAKVGGVLRAEDNPNNAPKNGNWPCSDRPGGPFQLNRGGAVRCPATSN